MGTLLQRPTMKVAKEDCFQVYKWEKKERYPVFDPVTLYFLK